MKKLTKILLILGVAVCLVGVVLLGVGRFIGGDEAVHNAAIAVNESRTGISQSDLRTYKKENLPLDNFSRLDVDLANIDLTIKSTDADQATLSYHVESATAEAPLHISVENGVLQLTESTATPSTGYADAVIGLGIPFLSDLFVVDDDIESQVTLYLPKSTYNALSLNMGYGNLNIDDVSFANGELNVANGDCLAEDTTLTNTTLTLNNGDLDCKNTRLEATTVSLSMGNFYADDMSFLGEISINVDLGDISIILSEDMIDCLSIDAATRAGSMEISDKLSGGILSDGDGSSTTTSFHRTLIDKDVAHLDIESNMADIYIR